MRVLVDTHALVWALSDPASLSAKARQVLTRADVAVSVASLWELILKADRKEALLADPVAWWNKFVTQAQIPTLSIRPIHVIALADLPDIHKDPFDRILVAQSLVEEMPLVTKDDKLHQYGIRVIW